MYHTILIPLDGSPFSEHALPFALTIAQYTDARICLGHVHSQAATMAVDGIPVVDPQTESLIRDQEHAYLDHLRERIQGNTGQPVTLYELDGMVVPTLTEAIAAHEIDLVVMTSHGRGGLARFWLGSVAEGLIRHSPVPVLAIRPQEGRPDPMFAPAFRRICIPLDGTEHAEAILEPALRLGSVMSSEYLLVRVMPAHPLRETGSLFLTEETNHNISGYIGAEARDYLDTLATRLRVAGYSIRTALLMSDHPASAIMHKAQAANADLIAMTTHGRGALSRLFIGSVADQVLRSSNIPVLLYRPQQHPVQHENASVMIDQIQT